MHVDNRTNPLNPTKFLSEDEYFSLETLLKRNLATKHHRDALMLLLALRTGARASELLQLKKKDYSSHAASIFVTGIKGSNNRNIPMPKWLCRALEQHLNTVDGEVLFDISYNRLRQIWDFYRPVKKTFHSLRHTFAINTYTRTRDIRLLQLALGHKSVVNTMVYVDYVFSLNELKKIVY